MAFLEDFSHRISMEERYYSKLDLTLPLFEHVYLFVVCLDIPHGRNDLFTPTVFQSFTHVSANSQFSIVSEGKRKHAQLISSKFKENLLILSGILEYFYLK